MSVSQKTYPEYPAYPVYPCSIRMIGINEISIVGYQQLSATIY
jgi:hypothetical protein